jgi:GTP cyclohydrolase II
MTKMPLKRQADAMLPTRWGNFRMVAYARRSDDPLPHLAMVHENFDAQQQPILVRVHSECMTGDVFHSHRCDCGEQLDYALNVAAERGGVVIYLRQEGRGIGLINKLKAYQLQDKGFNTAEANLKLGFKADERTYEDAKTILEDLGIKKIILLTNNPLKINYLEKEGIEIVARESIIIESREENEFYLHTKRDLMGHLF